MHRVIIINILKPGMMKTKSTTVITLERLRKREILEEPLSNFNSNGNTLVFKLKDPFMSFHIIVMFHNLHTSYINFSYVANIAVLK